MKLLYIVISILLIPNLVSGQEDRIPETEVELEARFLDAFQLKILEKWDESLVAFLDLEMSYRKNDVIKYEIAKIYEKNKENQLAISYVSKAIELNPDREIYKEYLIDLLILEKDFGALNEQLQRYIENGNQKEENYFQLSRNYEQMGNPKEALKVLKQVERISGYTKRIGNARVRLYQKQRNKRKLKAELEKLSTGFPGDVNILHHKAVLLQSMNEEESAFKTYKEILNYQPDHVAANIFISSYNQGEKSENDFLTTQMKLIENVNIPLDDKIKQLIPFVPRLEKGSGMTSDMLVLLDALNTMYPEEAKVYALSGDVYFNSDMLEKAAEYYQRTLQADKSNFMVWKHLMLSLDITLQFDRLTQTALEAIEYYPNQAICFYYLGKALIEQNELIKGLNWLQEGVWLSGNNDKLRSEFFLEMTFGHLLSDQISQAQQTFSKVEISSLGPDHSFYFEVLGDIMFKEQKTREALENWKKSAAVGGRMDRLTKKINKGVN
jgi:tetratricopeptide (TPR) repeat protein